MNVSFKLEQLTCPSCSTKIEKLVKKLKGINEVSVIFSLSKVKVSFDETLVDVTQIERAINKSGYRVIGKSE